MGSLDPIMRLVEKALTRPIPVHRWGTVTAVGPLRVRLDGDADPLPFTPQNAAGALTVGARVWCVEQHRRVTVLTGGSPDLTGMHVRVGSAEATTADQTGITTTATEITGTSVSFTLAAAGTVVFTGVLSTYSSSAGDVIAVQVRDGSTVLREYVRPANSAPATATTTQTQVITGELALTAGSHRLNLAVVRLAGSGSITVTKASIRPSALAVDRII